MLDKKYKWHQFNSANSRSILSHQVNYDTLIILSNIISPDLLELEKAITRVGLPFKRIIKPENYYRNISSMEPDLFRVSMLPAYPDPIEYYSLFYSKNSCDINLGRFSNIEFDKLYEKILYEFDDSILVNYYTQMEDLLKEEVAAIYMTHQGPNYYIFPKDLKNLSFKYVQLDFRKAYFE